MKFNEQVCNLVWAGGWEKQMRDRWFVDIAARVKSRVACQLPIVLVQAARAGCGTFHQGNFVMVPHTQKNDFLRRKSLIFGCGEKLALTRSDPRCNLHLHSNGISTIDKTQLYKHFGFTNIVDNIYKCKVSHMKLHISTNWHHFIIHT